MENMTLDDLITRASNEYYDLTNAEIAAETAGEDTAQILQELVPLGHVLHWLGTIKYHACRDKTVHQSNVTYLITPKPEQATS